MQNEVLKLLNFIRGYSNNFKQDKRDFCPFLKSILLRFFKKGYPNLLCVQKKKKKKENQMIKMNSSKLLKLKPVKERQY